MQVILLSLVSQVEKCVFLEKKNPIVKNGNCANALLTHASLWVFKGLFMLVCDDVTPAQGLVILAHKDRAG